MLQRRGAVPGEQPNTALRSARLPLRRAISYGSGEAAFSLVNNGLFGFALLFYTEALGLPAALAGAALSVSVFWEAVTEPLIGHLSDRTRSRFGSRYPWLLAGALLMTASFYAIWLPPAAVRGSASSTFAYLVVANLVLRTGMTMFFIPYLALGFEIVPDSDDRVRLQGTRWVCNMAANFAGPGLAWIVFLRDVPLPNGGIVKGTTRIASYQAMGAGFAIAALGLALILLVACRASARDNRMTRALPGHGLHGFWSHMAPVALDRDARRLYVLTLLLVIGMVIFSSLETYLYVHFIELSSIERSVVHGSTMAAAALGATVATPLARRFGRRGAVMVVLAIGLAGLAGLALAFLTDAMPRRGDVAIAIFVVLQGLYWLASGAVLPIVTSMVGDVAETRKSQGHIAADGGYAAIFSLMWRLGTSFSLLASGWLLSLIGLDGVGGSGAVGAATAWKLGAVTFAAGGVFYAAAMAWVARFRVEPSPTQAGQLVTIR